MTILSNAATALCDGLKQSPETLINQGLLRQVGTGFLIATTAGKDTLRQLDPTHTSMFDPTRTNDPTRTSDPDTHLTQSEKALLMDLMLTDNAVQDLIDMGWLIPDEEGRLYPNKEYLNHE